MISAIIRTSTGQSAVWGVAGAVLGYFCAQCVPANSDLTGTTLIGALVGAGIGMSLAAFSVREFWGMHRFWQTCAVGAILGLVGGATGAGSGQLLFAYASPSSDSPGGVGLFSSEMRKRLLEAGAKAGEIEIGLLWENANDLDLHVRDPQGDVINFAARRSRSGGELDVDRNAACTQQDPKPVEHVVWPKGAAPPGTYEIYVDAYANCGADDPTPFRVELVLGSIVESFEGRIGYGDQIHRVHTFRYPPRVEESSVPGTLGASLGRVVGWLIFGAVVGCAQGVVRRSREALRNGTVGGAAGGALGGVLFSVTATVLADSGLSDAWARLVGFSILGACIGFCIVLVERALSSVLSVRSGRYEGRDIVLDRPVMRLGRSELLEVFLGGDAKIRSHHATVERHGNDFVLVAVDGVVTVNDHQVSRHTLCPNDSVVMGSTRMVFRGKRSTGPEAAAPLCTVPRATPTTKPGRAGPLKPPPPPPPPSRKNVGSPARPPNLDMPLKPGKGPPPPPPPRSSNNS